LSWYDRNGRHLPWRSRFGQVSEPYKVWLSEAMLQQTTVAAAIPYYEKFLSRFPTVAALAAAPIEEVLQAWAGLGYYARARSLHACARIVAERGAFPTDLDGLRALPGIGPYTAAAIAAIAFAVPVVPVDANVRRVVARLFAIGGSGVATNRAVDAAAQRLAGDEAARARPGDFVQALFDLGAGICTSRTPTCLACPWADACVARSEGRTAELPTRATKAARPVRHGAHFWLIDRNGDVLLRRRPMTGLLGGLLELPGTDWREAAWSVDDVLAHAPLDAAWSRSGAVRHIFTHFELRLDIFAAEVERIELPGLIVAADGLAGRELSSLMRKCIKVARASANG